MTLFLYSACFFAAACITVPIILVPRLNPKFDPVFKKQLKFVNWVPSFSTRIIRAGIYASWVTSKNICGRNYQNVLNYDFRSQISRTTYILCWVHNINSCIFIFFYIPFGLFYLR